MRNAGRKPARVRRRLPSPQSALRLHNKGSYRDSIICAATTADDKKKKQLKELAAGQDDGPSLARKEFLARPARRHNGAEDRMR